jgi:hypothetical protein
MLTPELKFMISATIMISLKPQATALKFGAIARIIKLNDWSFQAMPSPPDADGDISQLELDLIMEGYKEKRKIIIRKNAKIRNIRGIIRCCQGSG